MMKCTMVARILVILCCALFIVAGCAPKAPQEMPPMRVPPSPPTPIPAAIPPPTEVTDEVAQLFQAAEDAYKEGAYDRALDLYDRVIEQSTRGNAISLARMRRGEIFFSREEQDRAIEEWSFLKEDDMDKESFQRIRLLTARTYFDRGNQESAGIILAEMENRGIPRSLRGDAVLLKADIAFADGLYRDSLSGYLEILDKAPEYDYDGAIRKLVVSLIDIYFDRSDLEDLAGRYKKGFPAGYILARLGEYYCRDGNYDSSERVLKDFISRFPGHEQTGMAENLLIRITKRYEADPHTLGCIMPLTGKFGPYGTKALDAVVLATEIFNSTSASPVTLYIEDSGSNAETAREAVRKLALDRKAMGIIGPLGSITAQAAAEEAQRLGVPIMTLTQRPGIADVGDFVFRNFLTADMQIRTVVAYAMHNLGYGAFAILYPEDAYGTEMMKLFWNEALTGGGEIHAVESYKPGSTDFGSQIKALFGLDREKASGRSDITSPVFPFEALFIPGDPATVLMIAPQLAFYNVTDLQLFGVRGWDNDLLSVEDSQYVEGLIFVDGFFANSYLPHVRQFVNRFFTTYGRMPTDLEALSYDSARIMVDALLDRNVEIREDLRDHLRMTVEYPGVTGLISFSSSGDADKILTVLMIANGEVIQIE
ncbi:MAG: ABC transporter substrate-binding protein [Deltaproteobacteria bacterium]|nr:ABC transporter substrate-binding protein [Deltaproteobacteria bacterium]